MDARKISKRHAESVFDSGSGLQKPNEKPRADRQSQEEAKV
jgi:hypothetical protein